MVTLCVLASFLFSGVMDLFILLCFCFFYKLELQLILVKGEESYSIDAEANSLLLRNKVQYTIPDPSRINETIELKHKHKKKMLHAGQMTTQLLLNHSLVLTSSPPDISKKKRKKRKRKKKYNQRYKPEATNSTDPRDFATNKGSNVNMYKSIITFKKRNRCNINNGGCSQICLPRGRKICSCVKGYVLAKNKKRCIDVNECRKRNGGCQQICQNTLGAYFCTCNSGFRLSEDLKSCNDINECHLRNGHGPCQDTCINTIGSYICHCSNLKGSRLSSDNHTCEDIDECKELDPGCSHMCLNTRNGAYCGCPEGLELMSDYKTCQDIDECEDTSLCTRGCVNTVGSYYCEEDFYNDNPEDKANIFSCPPLDLPPHGFITCLRNNSLPYDTFTKNGRKIINNSPGTKCHLECPIGFTLLGEGRYLCGFNGKWIVKKRGSCIKVPHPRLQCPPDQTFFLQPNELRVLVHFPPPQSSIRWKMLTSYPAWAKNLKGEFGEGYHNIQFSVTDSASKLSSTCSFAIIIKKQMR